MTTTASHVHSCRNGTACGCEPSGALLHGRERMLAALALRPVDRPPVWMMRQAGRHLPGYRAIRKSLSFLDICRDEDANRLVSAEPAARYGLDAAIVFNDILIPLIDMGMRLDFVPGPRFERLIRTPDDAKGLCTPAYGEPTDVCRCLRALRAEVGERTAVLGFVGSPFTVASFAIAGAGKQRATTLEQSTQEFGPALEAMQRRLVPVLADYAAAQTRAGADVIQIFESLATEVEPGTFARVGLPFLMEMVGAVRRAAPGTPVIVFGRGIWDYVPALAGAGAAALSLDWTRPLGDAREALRAAGLNTALQGNLDPGALLELPAVARARAQRLLNSWPRIVPLPGRARDLGPTGWVFNLGHGVPENASPDTVQAVVDAVKSFRIAHNEEVRS